jgi:DNA replication licensing factor MCM2
VNAFEEDQDIESEGSGEDLDENMDEDYRAIPELDQYEAEGIDEEDYSDLDYDARQAADADINRRRLAEHLTSSRVPSAFNASSLETDFDIALLSRHRAMRNNILRGTQVDDDLEDQALDFEDPKGKLSDWIKNPKTQAYIFKTFRHFLMDYGDEHATQYYRQKTVDMCAENSQSLEVSYLHIKKTNPTIALWIYDEPLLIIPILNEVVFRVALELFPDYSAIYNDAYLRIRDLPVSDLIRNLRFTHLNKMIKVTGVVTRRTAVYPQLRVIVCYCNRCGDKKGPLTYNSNEEIDLGICGNCQSKGPFTTAMDETIYRNYQKITLQETPSSVPAGRVPRHKELILLGDLIDIARPGDEIEVTGIYTTRYESSLNIKHGFPVFSTVIEANCIRRLTEAEHLDLTEEDKFEIRKLSQDPSISALIESSIGPSIYGHQFIKKAITLAMFGGQEKDIANKHRIRGDINVLLLGDPGTAKSQFLKYVQKTAPRCVYTTGKGASAVGLTAGVRKDPITKEWILEGGALVLADRGICLIDEFDKMNDQDRTSIHEAMEQQSISISKAGIVTSLQARCAIIAAANPVKGRYDPSRNFFENVDLTEPILSRFDILCVVRDEVNLQDDHDLATFVITSHTRSHPQATADIGEIFHDSLKLSEPKLSQDMLKKYIHYARLSVKPQLSDIDHDKLTKFYATIRKISQNSGGIPIAVRHLESVIRMSEANAKMHLREHVTTQDVDIAINVLIKSFLQSQKLGVRKALEKKLRRFISYDKENDEVLFHLLNKLFADKKHLMSYQRSVDILLDEANPEVSVKQFECEAREHEITEISGFLNSRIFALNFKEFQGVITENTELR